MFTLITQLYGNVYGHKQDAESVDIAVTDTGKRVTVLEWVGTAYGSGQREVMHYCTLYTDGVNYYTDFDGDGDLWE
jgi:hypothetical protein